MAAPVFTNLDDTPTFTEAGPSVLLDDDALLTDSDISPTDPIDGATLVLARLGGASEDDLFSSAMFDEGQVISQISGLVVGIAFLSAGALTVIFNSDAAFADAEDVLQSLQYANASSSPPASVTIGFTFDNGEQATGSITVGITPINEPPTLDGLAPAFYQPGSSGVVLSSGVMPADLDSANLNQATVALDIHPVTDLLSVDVGSSGIVPSYDSGTGILTLTGTASVETYRQVLASVTYSSSAPDPSLDGTTRVLTWQVRDSSGALSGTQQMTLGFAPLVDLDQSGAGTGFATSFTENGSAVAIVDTDVAITPDDSAINGAVVTLTNAQAGDTLSASGAGIPFTVDSSIPGQITLTFTGAFTPDQFELALAAVRFDSPGDSPVVGVRDITVSVTDGNGITSNVAHAAITVNAVNDPGSATNDTAATKGNVVLQVAAADGVLANDSDPDGLVVITGAAATSQGGSIQFAADGSYAYTPPADFLGTDTVGYTAQDPLGNQVSATLSITVGPQAGTPGDESFSAPSGNSAFDGGYGNDTVTFAFNLVDATVSHVGNTVVIDGPSSHTVLSGFDTYVFADGTVHNGDGNPLVDDLFYFSQNHDVWNAHIDAEAHYNSVGWQERRDPNAFFSTLIYLSANPDVAAAGTNPLTHFDQIGWKEGRVPSLDFDPAQYLAANPDVAAAQFDPLWHFLALGASEGRQPAAPTELIASNGFDYVYYLQNNPDVAAAQVDPLQHFQTTGWKEGRNPNALFDTAGYLATYSDVAAANFNPLDHYHLSGWKEGRDPSLSFDTEAYLASNPDVAAANIDPLLHFLLFGQHEGRQAVADATWG